MAMQKMSSETRREGGGVIQQPTSERCVKCGHERRFSELDGYCRSGHNDSSAAANCGCKCVFPATGAGEGGQRTATTVSVLTGYEAALREVNECEKCDLCEDHLPVPATVAEHERQEELQPVIEVTQNSAFDHRLRFTCPRCGGRWKAKEDAKNCHGMEPCTRLEDCAAISHWGDCTGETMMPNCPYHPWMSIPEGSLVSECADAVAAAKRELAEKVLDAIEAQRGGSLAVFYNNAIDDAYEAVERVLTESGVAVEKEG